MIKQVPNWPYYAVSDDGRVFSCKYGKWREMKLSILRQRSNHRFVRFWENGKSSKHYVHRLVLETFIGPCPKGMETRHKDDNPENNHLDNLAWGTFRENINDRLLNGRTPRKINKEDVVEIRHLYSLGKTQREIGGIYHLKQATIHQITSRKTWKHVV